MGGARQEEPRVDERHGISYMHNSCTWAHRVRNQEPMLRLTGFADETMVVVAGEDA